MEEKSRTICVQALELVMDASRKHMLYTNSVLTCVLVCIILKVFGVESKVYAGHVLVGENERKRHAWLDIGGVIMETDSNVSEKAKSCIVKYELQTDDTIYDDSGIVTDLLVFAGQTDDDICEITDYTSVMETALKMKEFCGLDKVIGELF